MSEHGTLRQMPDGRYELRYERHYPHPPEKVWRALIEPSELQHWFPSSIEGERKAGAKLRFVFEGQAGPVTEGVMRVFDPPRVLEFTWMTDVLRFELTEERDGSKLVFSTTFDERVVAPRSAAGWHKCLEKLAEQLGRATKPDDTAWHELYRSYASEFGASDYPAHVKRAGVAVKDALQTPGLDGSAFSGHGDARIELLRASKDAATPRQATGANEYIMVLEGRYELQVGGGELVLERGMEFAFPAQGFQFAGKITAGTRILRARGG